MSTAVSDAAGNLDMVGQMSTELVALRAENARLRRSLADAEAERNACNVTLDLMNRVTAYQLYLDGKLVLTPEQRERLFAGIR